MVTSNGRVSWVVLVHRVPREPSTPRIAIWRKLRALGAAQLGDGVVALPEDARTREHLEWVADQVVEAGGTALLLRAQTLARRDEERLARGMADARAEEYRQLTAKAAATHAATHAATKGATGQDVRAADAPRALKRLRQELRSIQRRDYFPPPERDTATSAVAYLAAQLTVQLSAHAHQPPPPAPAPAGDHATGAFS